VILKGHIVLAMTHAFKGKTKEYSEGYKYVFQTCSLRFCMAH
jgi:hypothetical protein